MTRLTFDLSGMGGGYEDMCQLMLWRGVLHLAEVRPHPAIVCPGEGATGAMHQCVMGHLRFIHLNGLDAWRTHLAPARPEGPYEWDDQGRLGRPTCA